MAPGQLDFRLKIYILELDSQTTELSSSSSSSSTAGTVTSTIDYVTRVIDTFDVCRNDIDYRAEGNANIVLTIPKRCQVLRLPKISKSKQNICRSTAKECSKNKSIFYVYKYIDRVSKLFGQNIASRPILVRIEFCNVDAFMYWLHNRRPVHRIQATSKKRDDFDFDYGLLYHDACSLNLNLESSMPWFRTYCDAALLAVEIKPKQGWNICTELSEWLLELFQIGLGLRNKCRYCAMQHQKVNGRNVKRLSKYCPLDLFSGDKARMKKAISGLIESPQNNFRVFCNGHLIYSDINQEHDLQSILSPYFGNNNLNIENDFISLLVNILLHDFDEMLNKRSSEVNKSEEPISFLETTEQQCTAITSSHLPNRSILKRVLDLQLLAKKTIPYIAQKYLDDANVWVDLIKNVQWSHSHVSKLCQKLDMADENIDNIIDYEYLKTTYNLSDEQMYEIGATALDSSIMLTFQCIDQQTNDNSGNNEYAVVNLNDQQFIVSASVFDLDPKFYPRHFTKYVQKTRESYNAYQLFLNAENP
ncbi:inositol-pentakisphosphate 2-kinase [Contarinia nasturtii]|uniref:inositol-pentakisphosphate 2-kinase n=1 Tax=Contarinia nasturtii TaxID=265458 RepID=UPI0012D38B8C|nr:inositol-pentakisphosphate 2-kinase [Contarinia nasturtii]XP_031622853.1 inositol-pentakisphosphate 2-kinase [Contarinia nasturtii]XP_031622854.1 inositol-pentakisphosphate 2-kinase [Contarinia nasturtii]